jgi:hypothetical protein
MPALFLKASIEAGFPLHLRLAMGIDKSNIIEKSTFSECKEIKIKYLLNKTYWLCARSLANGVYN